MFGLGWQEIVFILILFFLLGPEESVKTARLLGRLLRKLYLSTFWRVMSRLRFEFEQYIREEIRRAGLEEFERWQTEMSSSPPWEEAVPSSFPPQQAISFQSQNKTQPPDTAQPEGAKTAPSYSPEG